MSVNFRYANHYTSYLQVSLTFAYEFACTCMDVSSARIKIIASLRGQEHQGYVLRRDQRSANSTHLRLTNHTRIVIIYTNYNRQKIQFQTET